MQKKSLLFGLCLLTTISSCSKKDPEPLTRTQLLTAKKWQLRQAILSSPNSQDFDSYTLVRPCTQDDYWQFSLPNIWTTDEGPTKCGSIYPQTQDGTWELSSKDTRLTLIDQNFTDIYTILRLMTDTLKMSTIVPQNPGPDATFTVTYTTLK